MKKLKLTCHACRNECEIEVTYEDGEVLETEGNGCIRGMIYAQNKVNELDE